MQLPKDMNDLLVGVIEKNTFNKPSCKQLTLNHSHIYVKSEFQELFAQHQKDSSLSTAAKCRTQSEFMRRIFANDEVIFVDILHKAVKKCMVANKILPILDQKTKDKVSSKENVKNPEQKKLIKIILGYVFSKYGAIIITAISATLIAILLAILIITGFITSNQIETIVKFFQH